MVLAAGDDFRGCGAREIHFGADSLRDGDVPLEDTVFSGTWCYSNYSINVGDTIDDLGLHVSTYVNAKPSSISAMTADNNGYSIGNNYVSNLSPEYYTVEGFDSSTPGGKELIVHVGDTSSRLSYYVY